MNALMSELPGEVEPVTYLIPLSAETAVSSGSVTNLSIVCASAPGKLVVISIIRFGMIGLERTGRLSTATMPNRPSAAPPSPISTGWRSSAAQMFMAAEPPKYSWRRSRRNY